MLSRRTHPNITTLVLDDYEADRGNRGDFEANFRKWTRMYDQVIQSKSFPFQDASNISIPLIAWTVDALHSRLINPLFMKPDWIDVKPSPSDWFGGLDRAKSLEQFLNWQFQNSLDFFSVMDETLARSWLYGSWFVKVHPLFRDIQRRSPDGTTRFETAYRGPWLTPVSPMDLLLPSDVSKLSDADHVIHRAWLSIPELLDRERKGFYFDVAGNVERLRSSTKFRDQEPLGSISLGDTKVDFQAVMGRRVWLEVLESYYRYDFDDDGFPEEWIFTVVKDARLLVRATPLIDVYPSGERPWVQFHYKRSMRGPYGKGLGQELDDLNIEANTIINQLTDAGTIAMAPPVLTRIGSGAEAKLAREDGIYPGIHIPTDNPESDLFMPSMAVSTSFGMQDLQLLFGFAERLSGITDFELGRQPNRSSMPRTYGQQLLMQESSGEAMKTVALRLFDSLSLLIKQVHWLNQIYLPPMNYFRVTGQDARETLGAISVEDMVGQFDFSIKPVTPARNKTIELQQRLQAVQFVLPLLDRARVDPAYFKLVKMVWEAFGQSRLEEVIGEGEDPIKLEHVAMLQNRRVVASPYDDAMRHVGMHFQFAKEAEGQEMQDVAMMAYSHIKEHMAVAQQRQGGSKGASSAPETPGKMMQRGNAISPVGKVMR